MLLWKDYKSKQPKIIFKIIKRSYKIEENKEEKSLILNIKLLFENKGNASGSVTDLKAWLRYSEKALKMNPQISGMLDNLTFSERISNYENIFPIEINPYGSKNIEAVFKFNKIDTDFLDRCGVPINFKHPKWDWKDLPILVKLRSKTTNDTIESDCCVFREDLPDSQEIYGTINEFEESTALYNFSPKIELPVGHGELILVAGNDSLISKIILEMDGYKVLTAENGAEAVALYTQNKDKIKVIIMDLMMPVMNSEESIRTIRKINPEVKIIASSGLTEKDRFANVADYTNAFLPKPYTAKSLLRTIHEVIGSK